MMPSNSLNHSRGVPVVEQINVLLFAAIFMYCPSWLDILCMAREKLMIFSATTASPLGVTWIIGLIFKALAIKPAVCDKRPLLIK